mmetsp:Transcript_83147/g.193143  ORF Transcript_83147/g.193143 Transcript_83147/m.193143 type:complete len:105 (+) Transcript_83147:976-1290(+)
MSSASSREEQAPVPCRPSIDGSSQTSQFGRNLQPPGDSLGTLGSKASAARVVAARFKNTGGWQRGPPLRSWSDPLEDLEAPEEVMYSPSLVAPPMHYQRIKDKI